jgi:hypothetical protein
LELSTKVGQFSEKVNQAVPVFCRSSEGPPRIFENYKLLVNSNAQVIPEHVPEFERLMDQVRSDQPGLLVAEVGVLAVGDRHAQLARYYPHEVALGGFVLFSLTSH